jgi:hypothetical protein
MYAACGLKITLPNNVPYVGESAIVATSLPEPSVEALL